MGIFFYLCITFSNCRYGFQSNRTGRKGICGIDSLPLIPILIINLEEENEAEINNEGHILNLDIFCITAMCV